MSESMLSTILVSFLGIGVFLVLLKGIFFRRVVPANEVHIVQVNKKTISYGKDSGNGNIYYEWPSWVPFLGVVKTLLPVSVFDLDLASYEAYDRGRLPFVVDVKAFFRISDSNVAAQRVASFEELHNQLKAIVQGAVRTILANNDIEEIMQGRSKFGDEFTKEVGPQLSNWGVETVKNIELMDLRDGLTTKVIHNIMEKKKSHIEMQSRQEVAKNMRDAEMTEIEAKKDVGLKNQEAQQLIGLRTVETKRQVDVANQSALQTVKDQEKVTKEKEMAVLQVAHVRSAEIDKLAKVIIAQQSKEITILSAEAQLEFKRKEAEGLTLEGKARAEAEKAMQLAPVQAQITLAQEIGSNTGYQQYLVSIRQIEATQAIGMEQATALEKANIKIIANTGGEPTTGLTKVMDLFSSNGGTKVGAMLEGLAQTETGNALLSKVGLNSNTH